MNSKKIMVIDGNSIINRAFYGLQGANMLTNSEGIYTNAIFGFLNILFRFMEEEKPDSLCIAFDLKAPTFRHKEYDGYKAKRKGMPPELAVQVPLLKEVLDAMRITRLECEGYEADDIIGSVSACAEQRGMSVIIITGDRDALQLASDTTRIKIPSTKGGKAETNEYDRAGVIAKYEVTPQQLIDVKGLMGDPSDNIPGVPGVGEKTALELIKRFGTLEAVYAQLEQIEKKGLKIKLEENKELAFLSKRLATIDRNMQNLCTLEAFEIKEYDQPRLYALFQRLEFKSFIEKMALLKEKKEEAVQEQMLQIEHIQDLEGLKKMKHRIEKAGFFSLQYLLHKLDSFHESLIGLALTLADNTSVYFDLRDTELLQEDFLAEFKDIFESQTLQKYGHDLKRFIVFLKRNNIQFKGMAFDTMIASYILNPSRSTYWVADLLEEYAGKTIPSMEGLLGKGKDHIPFTKLPLADMKKVATTHASAILELKGLLEQVIVENNQQALFFDIELPLVEVLADMEYLGFKVNIHALKALCVELDAKLHQRTTDIYDAAGEEFNINSPKQLGAILFDKLGLKATKKTKTGYSTNAEVLEQLENQHPIIPMILEYRQWTKLKSTYVDGLIQVANPETGRIHSSFNQTVTTTGRISSTEPNLQNIPVRLALGREIRKVFVATNDQFVLLDADYSQIELRVLAHISGDSHMIKAFLDDQDIHTTTAAKVFKIPEHEVTAVMRSRAKAVNFGIVYGIGEFSLSKDLGITRKEAKGYIDEYLGLYKEVKQYMHDIVQEGTEKGFVTTLFGRRRYLPELKSTNSNIHAFGERIAMNTPIQGSAADIIKIAMVKVYRELANNQLKAKLILQVHDELIVEAPVEEKEIVQKILKDSMEKAVNLSVSLTVEVKTGNSWYDTK